MAVGELERVLLQGGDDTATALRRVRRMPLAPGDYEELVAWVAHLRISRGLSHRTVRNYLTTAGEFLVWCKAQHLDRGKVTASDIEHWIRDLYLIDGLAPVTRGLKLTTLRQFYGWRELEGMGRSPAREMRGPRRERRVPRKFSTGALRQLLAGCDRSKPQGIRDYALVLFVYATGARRQEVTDVSVDQLEIFERSGRVRFFGKGAKERMVPFEGPVGPALIEWLGLRDKLGYPADPDAVFVGLAGPRRGSRLKREGVSGVVKRLGKRAGLKVGRKGDLGLHRLRVTFATDMYDAGVGLEELRVLMGHNTIETTRQYLAITRQQLRHRMPRKRLGEVTGDSTDDLPLWAKAKLGRRGDAGST